MSQTSLINTNLILAILFDTNVMYNTNFICPNQYTHPEVLSVWGRGKFEHSKTSNNTNYYMAGSASRQDEVNPACVLIGYLSGSQSEHRILASFFFASWPIKTQKRTWPISSHLDLTLGQ